MPEALRIGTRGSRLALWQAHRVRDLLGAAHPGLPVEIVEIVTTGDRIKDAPLVGGTGFFTKEIERALLDERVDIAIHSLKDLPTELVAGLRLGAVPEREDPRDAIVGRAGRVESVSDLRPGVTVGTSSPRRRGQILAAFPGVEVVPLRGNVPTRVGRTREEGGPDAVVLAFAGLRRLGLEAEVTAVLSLETMLPAPAQGALGIEVREDDRRATEFVAVLDDPGCRAAVTAERAFLRRLEGGCTVPVGALAEPGADGSLRLRAVVSDPEGGDNWRDAETGSPEEAVELGIALADRMLESGASLLLDRLRSEGGMSVGVAGRTVLLTRDEGLADEVRALGATVRIVELVRYEAVPCDADLSGFDWVVFTSRRAVRFLGADLRGAPPIACIGRATAEEVERLGGVVTLTPERSDAGALAEALGDRGPVSGLRILFPCSEKALGTIEDRLGGDGATVVRRVAYRPVPAGSLPAGVTEGVDLAVFLAPSAVESFEKLGGDLFAVPALAIGPTTAAALRECGVEPVLAPTSDRSGLLTALENWEWEE